ncbi:terminase family protein [Candidatus Pacearchaeota archaeon]|nr:terminase family protein [Candidatus Pacearchaeota archaeon]
MWDTAKGMFSELPQQHRPKLLDYNLSATFPSGAALKFNHMEHVKDKYKYQGLQFSFIGFDEGTHFEWEQIEYLMSRMRSASKYQSRMVISCNPDPDAWILPLIEWYLDEDGYPDQEKDGIVRYFIRKNGEFMWGESEEELHKLYDQPEIPAEGKRPFIPAKPCLPISFSFVSANIYDNPPCMEANPEYVSFLEGLNPVDKARLLLGNWYARAEGSNYFMRDWLVKRKRCDIPSNITWARAWDKASTEPSDANKFPDFTASLKMGKDSDGMFWIVGDYEESNYDEQTDTFGRFKYRVGERDRRMLLQAEEDGDRCLVVLPVDPGAAGVSEFQEAAKKFLAQGMIVKKDPMPNNKSKLVRFHPFASAAELKLVHIVESTFKTKKTLEAFYKELEAFDGEPSTNLRKDDWADSTASAFNMLAKEAVIPTFRLNGTGRINNRVVQLKRDIGR